MRVIAGLYKGRNLKSPPSLQVRPTSDRLRETLFNIIAPRIEEARFLDLCAGSGAVGIEALSRGASHVTFVDQSRRMCALIEANLDLCRIPEQETEVVQSDASDYLGHASAHLIASWDIIFFDPPYKMDYSEVLKRFSLPENGLLTESGILIVEHHHKKALPDALDGIRCSRRLKQGDSVLSFYESNQS
ncbi:MAG: 16S rRNA (guanine(966)-N(2))-methyltransferase RsmD [Pyrinomonadaceae bacterium]